MKKVISLLLAVLTIMSVMAVSASAADTVTEGAYTYQINSDGTAYLIAVEEKDLSGTVTIPDYINGYPVTEIGIRAFYKDNNITKIYIPATVKEISYAAFYQCKIKEVIILSDENYKTSELSVVSGAFYECNELTTVHCYNRNSIYWSDTNTYNLCHRIYFRKGKEPVCQLLNKEDGIEDGWYCSSCKKYFEGGYTIPAKHTDEKDHNGECDRCGIVTCVHKCHKELTGFSAFIWKVELFFWKLFKIQKTCICGVDHY